MKAMTLRQQLRQSGLRVLVRSAWRRLRGGELTPSRAALSVGLGLFIGCLPLYGLHFALCVLVCVPLRLDLPVAYAAANISNPFVAPFLIWLEVEVGSLLLTGEHAALTLEHARELGVTGFVLQAMVGALVVASGLAVLGGAGSFWVASHRARSRRPVLYSAIERTVRRYTSASVQDRLYVAIKLRTDPVLEQISSLHFNLGRVLDVASGRGQLSLALVELGKASAVRGFDWDRNKVDVAASAASGDAHFCHGDVRQAEFSGADTVLMIDVLHYLSIEEQDAVLKRAACQLGVGSRLLIRESDAKCGFRSWLTAFFERVGRAIGANRGASLEFRPALQLIALLQAEGLCCQLVSAAEGPLSNVLILAERPEDDRSTPA